MAVTARSIRDLEDSLLRHQVFIQRLTAGERNKFTPFLKEMDREIRKRLSGATELTEYTRQRLLKLLKDVDGMLVELLGEFEAQLLLDIDAIAANEAGFTARALTTVVEVEAATPGISLIRSAVLNNPLSIRNAPLLKPFIKDWTQAQRNAVSGAIRRGVFEGQTNAQIVRVIRGTKARNYADGLLDTTRRHADTLVHTAIQHASSQARQATFEENKDIVEGSRWISTLDNATCFVAGTPVETPDGNVAIELLRAGDLVIGGSRRPRRVLGTMRRRSTRLVRVKLSNGCEVACTPDHLWLTERGWMEAAQMTRGEKLAKSL